MSYLRAPDLTPLESEVIHVLIVDDHQDLAELAARFLEEENDSMEVATETSVSDGFDRLSNESFDCIVSDYEMPGMDGLEFLEQLREEKPGLPFILFTGKGSEEIASEAISAGVTDYLQKESGTDQYTVLANRVENAVKQHRSKQAVEVTEEKLLQLAERTDDILFMFDGEWNNLLFINSSYEDIWGGSIAELQEDPQSFIEYIHPDDRSKAKKSVTRLLDGEPNTVEYRVRDDDGEYRWVRGETKPIFDRNGDVSRIAGFVRDITEQRERERSRELYRVLVEESPDAFTHVRPDSTMAYVNSSKETVGRRSDEFIGNPIEAFIHPEDKEKTIEFTEKLLAGDEGRIEVRFKHGNGSWIWLETTGTTLTNSPFLDGAVTISRDITHRKEREQKLERQNERLDRFASVVSHDIRNPLSVASGYAEMAQKTGDDNAFEGLYNALDRMEAMIDRLSLLTQTETKVEETQSISLSEIAHTAWETSGTPGAELSLDSPDIDLNADPKLLRNIFENLFRNATDHNEPPIEVTVGALKGADGSAGFFVEDDGQGIELNYQMSVFDDGFTTREQGGGIGLSIVKEFVEAHGWQIDLTNGDRGGARFEILTNGEPSNPS